MATIDKSYWQKRFNGARRLVHAVPDLMPALVSEAVAAPVDAIAAEADMRSLTLAAQADTQP